MWHYYRFIQLIPNSGSKRQIRIFTILALVVARLGISWSQVDSCTYNASGHVYDIVTGEPLMFATVQVEGTTIGVETDFEGAFQIVNICEKDFDLVFSYVGYKEMRHHHDFHHPSVEIYLAPDTLLLESVIVEGKAITHGLSSATSETISLQDIGIMGSEDFGSVAEQISGVNILSTGSNISKPVIHGLHSNRILLVNAGLRHEFQNWGAEHAPEIDPSMVDQLEVIKGAATVEFGPDAMGGVLLIREPEIELSQALTGKVSVLGKSNGRSGESTIALKKGYKWWGGMLNGSILKQGDLHAPDYQLTNTGKRERSISGGIRLHPLAELDINLYYSHFYQQLGVLRGSVNGNLDDLLIALESDVPNFTSPFSYDINTPKQVVDHDLYRIDTRWIGRHHSFHLKYGYQFNHRQEFDVRRGNDQEIPNIDLTLGSHQGSFEWSHTDIGAWSGKLGFQWTAQDNENLEGTNTVPFIPNYRQERFGIYAIESVKFNRHSLEWGLRFDRQYADVIGRQPNNVIYRNYLDFENVSGTVGFETEVTSHFSFRSNFGTAWRPPNIAELYRYGRHLSFLEYGLFRYELNEETDQIVAGNILTEEDRKIPNEIGYKWISNFIWDFDKEHIELTTYVNWIENYIYAKPAGLTRTVRGTFPYFVYDQTDALLWGIDVSSFTELSEKWDARINGSYLHAKQKPSNYNFVGMPPAKVSLEMIYEDRKWNLDNLRVSFYLSHTFRQFQEPRILTVDEVLNAFRTDIDLFVDNVADFDISDPPEGYFLSRFSFAATKGKLTLQGGINNIFNVRYRSYTDRLRYFADSPGRNFLLGLSWKL